MGAGFFAKTLLPMPEKVEIVAPAGNLASLKAAIENGADTVYLGFNDATNARNFEGLNFTPGELSNAISFVRSKGKKIYLAVNTFPQRDNFSKWRDSVDRAVRIGADALILADLGVLSYARKRYPDINIHLSVQASSSNYESINFYKKHFRIKRVILPRVLTIGEIKELHEKTDCELEVFVLGGLCINVEGRCFLSSFTTGASTNSEGACSPSRFVRFENTPDGRLTISLNNVLLNELKKGEQSPYPTCCKGRYLMPDGKTSYAMEDPESLNALPILPSLIEAGVSALKIEGRQRTKSYVGAVTRVLREAVDSYRGDRDGFKLKDAWTQRVIETFEGTNQTFGCYVEK
ncbi:MAG: U32 family peptidase [Deltaproteobacteria bacterium]|nr:U32 family peptidase [Deltaproteobacteria bacterium]